MVEILEVSGGNLPISWLLNSAQETEVVTAFNIPRGIELHRYGLVVQDNVWVVSEKAVAGIIELL